MPKGETEQEALELIEDEDAMRLHLEERLARGEPINEKVGVSKIKIVA